VNESMVQDRHAQTIRLPMAGLATTQRLLTGAAAKLPPINVFGVLANASTLAPAYMQYFAHLFKPLELDAQIERLLVLLTGKLSDCEYVWRQNVVVARSLGVTEEEIAVLHSGRLDDPCVDLPRKAAFHFAAELIQDIEVSDSTYAEVEKHFSTRAVTEIIYVVGSYMMLSRLIRTGRIPLDEKSAEVPPGFVSSKDND
jgi:alkylhydroperoxidase family enzyme